MSAINYDLKKIKGIVFDVDGVLSPSTIPIGEDGIPRRMANVKDGYAIQLAIKRDIKIAIITGASAIAIKNRFTDLGVKDVFLGCSNKLPVLKKWMSENNLSFEEIAYCGDDLPDFEAMRIVGLSACPIDASSEIKEISVYISKIKGGYGFGRDVIEQILKTQDKWINDKDKMAYEW